MQLTEEHITNLFESYLEENFQHEKDQLITFLVLFFADICAAGYDCSGDYSG